MSIEKFWGVFKEKVIPAEAHPAQLCDMKLAFFAGVHSMLQLASANAQSSINLIKKYDEEITAFIEGLKNDKTGQ